MNTLILQDTDNDIDIAAEILKAGGLVAIPTETVYGLAADALNPQAVAKIFKAKGRPMDNPLIVHIGELDDIKRLELVAEFPENAKKLAQNFWPGPLTMIMPKSKKIPNEVSAGLPTVAIRFPSHPIANKLIKKSGLSLAAPSANLSGSPSPTSAQHCINDLFGKVDAILDGGICSVGLESTVITLATNPPRLLRPGGITLEQLRSVIGEVALDNAVLNKLEDGVQAASPGMKYKHYAPIANVIILKGSDEAYQSFVNNNSNDEVAALCYADDIAGLKCKTFSMGSKNSPDEQAHLLFEMLREIDKSKKIRTVYARCPSIQGVGMAVYNRLIRAAGFEVREL